jgi:hypothetical protein
MRSGTIAVLWAVAAVLGVGPLARAAPAPAALSCSIDETRTFTPPLGALPGPADYTFTASGTAACDGVSDGTHVHLTGTVSVGNTFSTTSGDPGCDAWSWQEPAGRLHGTSASNSTSETRFIRWGPHDVTIVELANDDVTWLKLEGTDRGTSVAQATVTADATSGCPGQPATATVTATRAVGAQVRGALLAIESSCGAGPGCERYRLVGADVIAG